MLRDGLPRDRKIGGETRGRRRALLRQRSDHLPPRRVRQRGEDRIGAIPLHASITASTVSPALDRMAARGAKAGCSSTRTRVPSGTASSVISAGVYVSVSVSLSRVRLK